jgi:uncharacterized repeat protein (TIGR02543 family)
MIKKSKLFGLAAVITAIVLIAIIGVGVTSCSGPEGPIGPEGPQGPAGSSGADGSDGEDGEGGNSLTVSYTITYNSNQGSYIDPEEVIRGGKVIMPPIPPVREFTTSQIDSVGPGLYLAGDGGWVFKGWYLDGSPYDFNTAVNADITLTAEWTLPSKVDTGVDGINALPTATDFIEKACAYMRSNAATYILAIDQDYNVGTEQSPVAGLHLTIAGIGAERTITSGTGTGRLFNITTGANLVLGNNITLQGSAAGITYLINITNGTFTMENGSKLTGHKAPSSMAVVYLTGATSLFTMNGGEISGNEVGGVYVAASAEFIMNDGSITGNTPELSTNVCAGGVILYIPSSGSNLFPKFTMNGGSITGNDGHQGDVFVMHERETVYGTLTLSGNAEIQTLTTSACQGQDLPAENRFLSARIYVASGWTGKVENIYLYANVATNMADRTTYNFSSPYGSNFRWMGITRAGTNPNFTYSYVCKPVIRPAPGYTLTTADMDRFINLENAKFMNNQFPPALTSLSPDIWFISTLAGNRGYLVYRP